MLLCAAPARRLVTQSTTLCMRICPALDMTSCKPAVLHAQRSSSSSYHGVCRYTTKAQAKHAARRNGAEQLYNMMHGERSLSTSASRSQDGGAKSKAKVVDYLLADVGEGITECEIVKWFVEPGSHVEEFDVLVEVQSDKASVEITSRYTGLVKEHCYSVGQVARVGSPLCRIEVQGRADEADEEESEVAVQGSNSEGQSNEPARNQSGDMAADAQQASAGSGSSTRDQAASTDQFGYDRHKTLATPAVRRIIREHGVDIANVQGSGRDGRVMKEDVQAYLANGRQQSSTSSAADAANTSQGGVATMTSPDAAGQTSNIPLIGTRKAMFKGMTSTWTAPHFGYSDEIDVTKLEAIRKQINTTSTAALTGRDDEQQELVKITLLPFLLKALSLALRDHPIFRSKLDAEAMQLVQTEQHRMSIAFATPKGLMTPTLHGDVRQLSILDIARQINALQRAASASSRGLSQSELGAGATVTLSNIGSVGGTHTFPLLPPTGQLVIGAVGRTRILPRFDANDAVVKASVLPVSFSADHRVVEGVELAQFVNDWKRLLENPTSWLLSLR